MSINIIGGLSKEQDVRNPSYRVFNGNDLTASTMGTGWTSGGNIMGCFLTYQTTSVSGTNGCRGSGSGNNAPVSLGQPKGGIDWTKGVKLTTFINRDANAIDSNVSYSLTIGKSGAFVGALNGKGIGWKFSGTNAIQIVAYAGSVVNTSTNGTFSLTDNLAHLISVETDGTGKASLYVDNVLSASLDTGAPVNATGTSTNNYIVFDGASTGTPTATGTVMIGQIHLQTDI